jgi:riboflavin kinase/FMN adenylyltransferase
MGVAHVVLVPFTSALANMPPETFVREILVEQLQARHVVVGYNFRFGRRAAGSVETLQALGGTMRFTPHVLQPVADGGEVISSSRIRELLKRGELGAANGLLGHPYWLTGTVVHGASIGTETLKTPTANLAMPERKLVPADGVYAGTVAVDGQRHLAVLNIGMRPTFQGEHRTVEVHLLGYQGSLYDRPLQVALRHYLRPEKRFSSPDALREQIGRDIAKAKALLTPAGSLLPEADWTATGP